MAEQVCNVFNQAGYNFKVIHGGMNVPERQKLLNDLKTGAVDGLVNAALLTYGFDCPEVYYAFSCRHIKSRPLWFQMVGRTLRPCEGKEAAIFVDHGDSISEFAEPACALPIMDPLIKWRYDGVTKEEKKALKVQRNRANDVIRMINQLDPQPVDMVEVTTEDLITRLVRIFNSLTKEIGSMKELVSKAKMQAHMAQQKQMELEQENRKLRAQKSGPKKVIDSDKTFDYIRRNYCAKRAKYEGKYPKHQAHEMTVQSFLADEERLPFYYDKAQFEKGMRYWKNRIDKEGLD